MEDLTTYTDEEETTSHVKCDQCEMVSINGTACHEIGCPNSGKRWNESAQTWIKVRECFYCGFEVYGDEVCSCQDFDGESETCCIALSWSAGGSEH